MTGARSSEFLVVVIGMVLATVLPERIEPVTETIPPL